MFKIRCWQTMAHWSNPPFTRVGKWRFAETQPCSFLYRHYGCFCATLAELNSYKKDHPTHKCEILTVFPLKGKVCLPLFKIIITQDVEILLHCFLLMRTLRALSYCLMLLMSVWLLSSLLFSLWRLFRLSLYLCIYLKYHQALFLIYPF